MAPKCIVCVGVFVCMISNQSNRKKHMSDLSKLDALLHKTGISHNHLCFRGSTLVPLSLTFLERRREKPQLHPNTNMY